jgi:Brp/Blh family beta-carotene 15,15'-monooxygenase
MFAISQTAQRKLFFTNTFRAKNVYLTRQTVWFTVLPLLLIGSTIGISLFYKQGTPREIEVLPWLVALFFVGMPHGAADLAVLQSKKDGRKVWEAFLWYIVSMFGVFTIFILTPETALVGFIILSIWHFGSSENPKTMESGISYEHLLMGFAKGGIVIGTPLAAWPASTSSVATELITLVEPIRALISLPLLAHPIYPPLNIAVTGFTLLTIASFCWCLIFIHLVRHSKKHGTTKLIETGSVFFFILPYWHPRTHCISTFWYRDILLSFPQLEANARTCKPLHLASYRNTPFATGAHRPQGSDASTPSYMDFTWSSVVESFKHYSFS